MFARPISFLVILILTLCPAYLGGCGDPRVKEVEAADDRYDRALDTNNGHEAAAFISKSTVDRYTKLIGVARTASRKKVEGLKLNERYDVLQMRLLCTAAELKKMDGKQYYAKLVNSGWHGGSTSSHDREKIRIAGDRAFITYWDPDSETRSTGQYVFEDGVWKSDQTSDTSRFDAMIRDASIESGMSENELIFWILGRNSEGEIPDSIWNPPK